ncbi:MAG TPA: antitoxin Xre/MbcA/ParS toxin-binding domain-containing protein [Vitreimonas sp.]|uniref:antitoxin Xre/MbcA/ParS toxin-binding domain-containing protein n=1 Tax=Vitreimonas sp. TaxID=3069702 RepID=UPI002D550E62|nr:antitoxin Xre/MbcA/ParS toxin-binding domain-containing protein [Vitreimonas sp.]HYD87692.1 antitoxin Xre/MbcA/ParS toxin-binding domain-containing protein [Vitreimonas sp.]
MPSASRARQQPLPAESAVLTKAVVRAAKLLGLSNAALARILGVSPATITRLRAGEYLLRADAKEFELAMLFVRLFRSLDAIMGSDDEASKSWLRAPNRAFGGRPIDRILTVTGLVDVVAYLDASRAPV